MLPEFLVTIVARVRGTTYVTNNVNIVFPCQRQQSVASEVILGSWRTLRPGATPCTNYSSFTLYEKWPVGLHHFHVTACMVSMQAYWRIVQFFCSPMDAGDAVQGLLYL